MTRLVPAVPQAFPDSPITATAWNSYVYAAGFHMRAPSALLTQTISQSVPTSTSTRIAFDSAVRDTEGGHDPVTNNTRYTVKTPGTYLVSVCAGMFLAGSAGGEESAAIIVNETVIWAIILFGRDMTFARMGGCATAEIPLQTGDYVETQLWQDSGQTESNGTGAWMGLHWVGL
ncbi:hypothetical protein KGQ20_02180 [Catenulispora sp. NF23]|uniref:C1q domain-containing protein n=1 Tax=Catenulispora pinistramenti TaxID=2705254 RepID=A0ABS5KIG5_9ACTN|nr:hypothetical protein [Catenulispora pinistramenti]MBS2531573.1 hypothetical protein [Catenulispora pinistramenti]MBS2546177.1 hypothetical protein [Catenulispora pinistramenti]